MIGGGGGAVDREQRRVVRLAVGKMRTVTPVSSDRTGCEHLYQEGYCDGSHGRRQRLPSFLVAEDKAKEYCYTVELDAVPTTLVSVSDGGIATAFVPPLKAGFYG